MDPTQSSARTATSVQPARASIEYTCRLLRSYGIDLAPELIRQAKFNAATTCQPLMQALHDLALCVAAGLPKGCGEGIRALKQQIRQETVDGDTLPAEGVLLLLHLLAAWGCPEGLTAQLALPSRSSRACLLALAWLISHARLFDRALQHLQLPQQLLPLLPPYPEDTSLTATAQASYAAAASAAQQHAHKVQQLLQPQPAVPDGSCWQQIQAAAHHLLATYRSASMRLQLLTCLQEGREKLLHQIQQLQTGGPESQRGQGTVSHYSSTHHSSSVTSSTGASSSSSGGQSTGAGTGLAAGHLSAAVAGRGQVAAAESISHARSAKLSSSSSGSKSRQAVPTVLTAFELHLIAHPQLLQQHQQGLQQACSLLQQQLQCVQAAQTFFAWAASVLEEEKKAAAAANVCSESSHGIGTVQEDRSRAFQQQHEQLGQQPAAVADILPLLRQLPPASSPLAAQVLQRIMQQLQQAAAQAGVHTSSSSDGAAAGLAGLSLNGAQQVNYSSSSNGQAAGAAAATARFTEAAARAMVHSGLVPAVQQELLTLPEDIQQQLDKQQLDKQQQHPRQQLAKELIWHRQHIDKEQLSLLLSRTTSKQQQQSAEVVHGVNDVAGVERFDGLDVSIHTCPVYVPVAVELQRLSGLALHVAKQLAKTRASNKQHLQAAKDVLLGDDQQPGVGSRLLMYPK